MDTPEHAAAARVVEQHDNTNLRTPTTTAVGADAANPDLAPTEENGSEWSDVNHSIASRTITVTEVTVRSDQILLVQTITNYEVIARFYDAFLRRALIEDVTQEVAFGPNANDEVVCEPLLETLMLTPTINELLPETWERFDELKAISFKIKGKDDEKSRLDQVAKLISEISLTRGEIVSNEQIERTMRSTSATPHNETREMTFGSTMEITKQMEKIAGLQATVSDKHEKLRKQITAINAQLKPEDSGWQIELPRMIVGLQPYNAALAAADEDED